MYVLINRRLSPFVSNQSFPNLGQWCEKTTIITQDKDLTLEIKTKNQQQIQLQVIHYTSKVLTLKDYSQLLSASSKFKSD